MKCKLIRGQAKPEIKNKIESGCELVDCIAPEKFLGYIKFANFVVTNSFHAIALSLVFKKDFYSLDCARTERVKSFLKQLDMIDRHVNSSTKLISFQKIDYSSFDSKISKLKKESIRFLEDCCI